MTRVNIRAILADAQLRRRLMVSTIIAIQAREGIVTSREQAEAAYDKVQSANWSITKSLPDTAEILRNDPLKEMIR